MHDFFKDVEWLVEAHGLEVLYLQERHKSQPWAYLGGVVQEVGDFHGHPVRIECTKYNIDGKIIGFYCDTSVTVNHDLVNNWFSAHTKARKTNAMNFHHTRK